MKDFHILALSGGGFRGLFTARVLAGLEEAAGKPIGQCFDLICGTSIGGMIAMGLGIEKSAEKIAEIICKQGADIFSGKWCGLMSAKHDNKALAETMNAVFGDDKLRDCKHKILVPVVNYSTGKPRMFKTWWPMDGELRIADTVMAATAAPYYFPIWRMPGKDRIAYVDGGVYANSPGLLGVHEAVFRLGNDLEKVSLLSIGTMQENECIGNDKLNRGLVRWNKSLFDVIASAQDNLAHFMLKQQLGDHYQRIEKSPTRKQSEKLGLDVATQVAIDILSSTAQSEVQIFMGSANAKKWLEHVPTTNSKQEKTDDKKEDNR